MSKSIITASVIVGIFIASLGFASAGEIKSEFGAVTGTDKGLAFVNNAGQTLFVLGDIVRGKKQVAALDAVELIEQSKLLMQYKIDANDKIIAALSADCKVNARGADLTFELKLKPEVSFTDDLFITVSVDNNVVTDFRDVAYRRLFDASTIVDRNCWLPVRAFTLDNSELMIVRCGKVWVKRSDSEDLTFVRQPDNRYLANLTIRSLETFSRPAEPLRHVSNFSLYIDEKLQTSDSLFPLGILGNDTEFTYTAYMGGNYVPIDFRTQAFNRHESCFYRLPENPLGIYNLSIPAIAMTNGWKEAKFRVDASGKRVWGASYFDDTTRDQIYFNAASGVKYITSLPDHNSVLGWGIDNEYVPPFDYSPSAKLKFTDWLKKTYSNLTKLNQAWQSDYNTFDGIEPPHPDRYNKDIAAWLDWTRFQQESFADFLGGLYATMYNADPLKRRVTGKDTQTSLEMQTISRTRVGNHELIGQAIMPYSNGLRGMDHYGHGDRHAYEMNYYYNTIAPIGLLPGRRVGMVYGESNNHNGPAWQFDQTFYRMLPNGWRGGNFFCTGWFGSHGDWSSFSFINTDGTLRDKFFSVIRLNATIHRAEEFFAKCAVMPKTPKIAMLMPQRDLPLGVDNNTNPWEFAINSRLAVFENLRRAGFWVQVITYDKLRPEYMQNVDALFLVAAEHLTEIDLTRIKEYVKSGGKLFADTRVGMYNEHHVLHDVGLSDVLGVSYRGEHSKTEVDPGDVWFSSSRGNVIRADGRINADFTTAILVNDYHALNTSNKAARITMNHYGQGQAYWINTQMGTLRAESSLTGLPVVEWYLELLNYAGLRPYYRINPGITAAMRCEQPIMDDKGNTAIILSAATYEPVPAGTLNLQLPAESKFDQAFLSIAENTALQKIPFRQEADNSFTFDLPSYSSAAVIWLFHDHAPLLGYRIEGAIDHAKNDLNTPEFSPGDSFTVIVTIANVNDQPMPAGKIKLRALKDWQVSEQVDTPQLTAGEIIEIPFTVQIPDNSPEFIPNFIYPLLAEFYLDEKRTAIYHGVVTINVDITDRELLLSDNWSHANYPWAIWTGADYKYVTTPDTTPDHNQQIIDKIHAHMGDETPVYALQSGDRLDRRAFAQYKNIPEVELVFDLKADYSLTRLLIRRGNRYATETPNQIVLSFSQDNVNFSEPTVFLPWWTGEITELSLSEEIAAQFVRIKFIFPNSQGCIDDVWIFGKTIPGQAVGKVWQNYPVGQVK